MASDNTINLIKASEPVSPQVEALTILLRKLSIWALMILLTSGVVVSGIYYFLLTRKDQMVRTQQELSGEIGQNTTKEGLLATLKQRLLLINKIMGVQQPVSNVLGVVESFVPSGQISSVSLDNENNVAVTFHAGSIPDVISMTDAFIKQGAVKTIRSPKLTTLSIGKDGAISVSVSFIALF